MLAIAPASAYKAAMIDPAQIRAARALLNWKMEDLVERSGVSLASIKNIERGATDPRVSTLRAIQEAFEKVGLQFLEDDGRTAGRGVRFRDPAAKPDQS